MKRIHIINVYDRIFNIEHDVHFHLIYPQNTCDTLSEFVRIKTLLEF